jgi:hypothetical protein
MREWTDIAVSFFSLVSAGAFRSAHLRSILDNLRRPYVLTLGTASVSSSWVRHITSTLRRRL